MTRKISFILAAAAIALGGCYTSEHHVTDHSWREQRLLSVAIDRAVGRLPVDNFIEGPIAVTVSSHIRDVPPFIEDSIRSRLQEQGFRVSKNTTSLPATQILNIVVDAAAAESSITKLEIPFPIPLSATAFGLPLFRRVSVWAWVEYSGTLTRSFDNEVLATIPAVSSEVYLNDRSYLFFIGPFRSTNLLEGDPVQVLDWE